VKRAHVLCVENMFVCWKCRHTGINIKVQYYGCFFVFNKTNYRAAFKTLSGRNSLKCPLTSKTDEFSAWQISKKVLFEKNLYCVELQKVTFFCAKRQRAQERLKGFIQGCQIFLVQYTKTGKNIPKRP
jgi:hypothetical protein